MALPQPESVVPAADRGRATAPESDHPQRLRLMKGETATKPPILEVLPAALRREAFPLRCVCQHCEPDLNEVQRAAYERVERDWRMARIFWCDAHDYQLVELIQAERALAAAPRSDARTGRARLG